MKNRISFCMCKGLHIAFRANVWISTQNVGEKKRGFIAHLSASTKDFFIEFIHPGPFKWLTQVIFGLIMLDLMWMTFLGQLRSSLSHFTIIEAPFSLFFFFVVPFFFLFAFINKYFSQDLIFQELFKVQGIMKMTEHYTCPQNSPSYPVSLTPFLCIPSFLHCTVPFLAMGFTLVLGSIESTTFPLFVIDNWGNSLVKAGGINIRASFKAASPHYSSVWSHNISPGTCLLLEEIFI